MGVIKEKDKLRSVPGMCKCPVCSRRRERMGFRESGEEGCVTRRGWGNQTRLSLVGLGPGTAVYPKNSGKVLKGFKLRARCAFCGLE